MADQLVEGHGVTDGEVTFQLGPADRPYVVQLVDPEVIRRPNVDTEGQGGGSWDEITPRLTLDQLLQSPQHWR